MTGSLMPIVAMLILFAVLVFALIRPSRVQDHRRDPNGPKSTLAKDGPLGGVGFLIPTHDRARVKALRESRTRK